MIRIRRARHRRTRCPRAFIRSSSTVWWASRAPEKKKIIIHYDLQTKKILIVIYLSYILTQNYLKNICKGMSKKKKKKKKTRKTPALISLWLKVKEKKKKKKKKSPVNFKTIWYLVRLPVILNIIGMIQESLWRKHP